MLTIDILLSVVMLFVCIYSSISDFKTGKIHNSVIAVSCIVALILTLIKFIFFSQDDIFLYLKNIGIIISLSIVGYATRIWAGGDCKLAILISLGYPTLFYFDYNESRFTLYLFLALAFLFGFIYILFNSILDIIKDKDRFNTNYLFPMIKGSLFSFFKSFVFLTVLNQIYTAFIYPYFSINPLIYFVICIVFVYIISKIKLLNSIWIIIGVSVLDVILMIITRSFVFSTYWINYLLVFLMIIVRVFISKYNYTTIKTNGLKEGMVLSKTTSILMQRHNIKGMPGISDETLRSRLTHDEVQMVHRWGKTKHGKTEITIVKKIPFASFMAIALILYLIIGVLQFCGLV